MTLEDPRNLVDEFKGRSEQEIIHTLDSRGAALEIAIENLERDFNMGSIVRSANAFGVRHVHVIGRRQWNKRGAMATDRYLHVNYYATVKEFQVEMAHRRKAIIAVDNVPGARDIRRTELPKDTVLVFGSENAGISQEILQASSLVVEIRQGGSTRSLNVAAAAAASMYEWCGQ
ncbi:MAG: TrmH family RNA methyltransferase, partial [Patescibacteria group bacterium]